MRYLARRQRLILVILSVMLLLFLLISSACVCDAGVWVKVHNQTDRTLGIFISKLYQGDVLPREIKTIGTMQISPHDTKDYLYLIEAKTKEGEVVYSKEFTWQELDDMGWTIVIPPLPE